MKNYINQVSLRCGLAAAVALFLIFACGCGDKSSKGSTLTGKVNYKDEPLSGGSITLHSADGKGQFTARIGADGAYAISGISPGEWIVTVETESIRGKTGVAYQAPPGEKVPDMGVKLEKYVPIPKNYANPSTSPLRVTVKKGPQKQNFDLNESGQ